MWSMDRLGRSVLHVARAMAGLDRVREEGKKTLGRSQVGRTVEQAIRQQLAAGHGISKGCQDRRRGIGNRAKGQGGNGG
jgi:hypothetical protein